ncbi:MAG: hypothetical protein LBL52_00455 [Rickettsiales bacterium]|jgi:hypothetical protein|nr:hypothetical protein [Rickettsiales bacterium]
MAPKKKISKPRAPKEDFGAAITSSRYFKQAKVRYERINFGKFITDAWGILFNPVKFFGGITSDGRYSDTIFKVMMYGLMAAGIKILFNLSSITLVGAAYAAVGFALSAVMLTFALGGILMLFGYLAKGEMDFERALKSVAACMFMYPIAYVAYQLAFTYWMLFFFSILIDLYIVFLIYAATQYSLKGETSLANLIFGIFAALVIVVHLTDSAGIYMMYKNAKVVTEHTLKKIMNNN